MSAPAGTLESEALASVDPRIAARRRSVEGERRRRRRRRLLVVVVAVTLVAAAWLLTRTALIDVDGLSVQGSQHESAEEVVDASGIRRGDQHDPWATS